MKNRGLFIGLGVLAVAGIAYYIWKRKKPETKSSANGEDESNAVGSGIYSATKGSFGKSYVNPSSSNPVSTDKDIIKSILVDLKNIKANPQGINENVMNAKSLLEIKNKNVLLKNTNTQKTITVFLDLFNNVSNGVKRQIYLSQISKYLSELIK